MSGRSDSGGYWRRRGYLCGRRFLVGLRMVIARLWWRGGFYAAAGLLAIALTVLTVSILAPNARWLDPLAGPIFITSGIVMMISFLVQPRMGKAELKRRYRGLPAFFGEYLARSSPWTIVLYLILLGVGVAFVALSMTAAPAHSSVEALHGHYFLQTDAGRSPIGVAEFGRFAMATRVWGNVGFAVILQTVTLVFQRADRYIGFGTLATPGEIQ